MKNLTAVEKADLRARFIQRQLEVFISATLAPMPYQLRTEFASAFKTRPRRVRTGPAERYFLKLQKEFAENIARSISRMGHSES